MPVFSKELGIDLGTFNTIMAEGNQVVLEMPTVVALVVAEQKIVEIGQAAKDMMGRVGESIEVIRPLQNGVIADFEITEKLLGQIIQRNRSFIFSPKVMLTVPYGTTSVESRAVHE
ncbi:rod shape-determining protein, partial [bacterium]